MVNAALVISYLFLVLVVVIVVVLFCLGCGCHVPLGKCVRCFCDNTTQCCRDCSNSRKKRKGEDKFKSVLDFRLREVSESLMPKEKQIETLKTQLQDAESEFETQLEEQKRLKAKMEQKEQ